MKLLKDRILKDGRVLNSEVFKVDSFLNHQVDTELMEKMADEWFRLYESEDINKVLTIEASGIAMASFVARRFGVPLLFAKKTQTRNIDGDVWSTEVESFTHGKTYNVIVSKRFLGKEDKVLIIDDFLAVGNALNGLIDLVEQSGGKVVGCGIAIEKAFQGGGDNLRSRGYRVESLAAIEEMSEERIVFRE